MAAFLPDIFSYIANQHPPAGVFSHRLIGMTYLSDWKSCLQHGRQISNVTWCFMGGPQSYDGHDAIDWKTTSSGADLGRDWPTLNAEDIEAIDHVVRVRREMMEVEFVRLIHSTYPAMTRKGVEPLDLVDLSRRYLAMPHVAEVAI